MKTVGIVLINFNGWQDATECLKSLAQVETLHQLKVVLVDNASREEERPKISVIRRYKKNLRLEIIQNQENLGFAGGNNVGIKKLLDDKVDFIMLLNNDTIVDKHFIDPLVALFKEQPHAGIASPKIYFAPGYEFHRDRYKESEKGKVIWYAGGIIDWDNVYAYHYGVDDVDIGRYNTVKKTTFISGCCMMMKREVVENIGLLDEKYFMYLEDVDFCMRAKRATFELWFVPQSYIWHKNAQSSGKPGSSLHIYYLTRNRLLFGFTYASLRTKIALIRDSLRKIVRGELQKRAVVDYYLGRLGKATITT